MADIKCLQCDAIIADPCVRAKGLFLTKMELLSRKSRSPVGNIQTQASLNSIDYILSNELSLEDHEEKFKAFARSYGSPVPVVQPLVFTLECFRSHRNQYTITCNS